MCAEVLAIMIEGENFRPLMTLINRLPDPRQVAANLHATRYRSAEITLLAGSVARGDSTRHSDLDLVVVFSQIDHPYRESFHWDGWPVEVFAHDAETMRYFFTEVDGPMGNCSLLSMVVEGIEIPASSTLSQTLKAMAKEIIAKGPKPLMDEDVRKRRYLITDLVDDLRSPRTPAELVATGARLYEILADCFLRLKTCWSAQRKALLRQLESVDRSFAARYAAAFDALFRHAGAEPVIELAGEVLRPYGGWLFDGHRLDAPATWRKSQEDEAKS